MATKPGQATPGKKPAPMPGRKGSEGGPPPGPNTSKLMPDKVK